MKYCGPKDVDHKLPLPGVGVITLADGKATLRKDDGTETDDIPEELVPVTIYQYGFVRQIKDLTPTASGKSS